jgi:CzcA family heavy metal efflux pump
MLAALVRLAVHRSGLVLFLAALALVIGVFDLWRAELDIFPEFAPQTAVLQTEAPGLTALEVEQRVTAPIEAGLLGLPRLQVLRSESIGGLSVINLVFDSRISLLESRQMVAERLVSRVSGLPAGVNPVLVPLASSSATVLTFGLTAQNGDLTALREYVDATLVPRLLAVSGVADVNVFGGFEPALTIQPDWARLARHDIALGPLMARIEQMLRRPALGAIATPLQQLELGLEPPADWPRQLTSLSLAPAASDDPNLRLGDVASVAWGHLPPVSAAQIRGEPGVILMVIGGHGVSTQRVSRELEAVLAGLAGPLEQASLVLHSPLFRPADYVETAVGSISRHLAAGAVTVVLVLLLFLYDWRATLIATLAIPLSLLTAFSVLVGAGYSLNLMIIGGLAIALGEVVDDAIIDCENIQRRLRENAHRALPRAVADVIYDASMEVRGSVVFATFIVALVFVPLLTLDGLSGRLFGPLGGAYILAILASLLVALTVTPALCRQLLRTGAEVVESPLVVWVKAGYLAVLGVVLNHPRVTVLATGLLCTALMAEVRQLGGEFLPPLREGHYLVHTSSLPGTALPETIRIGQGLTRRFLALPGVESVSQWAGRAERGADTYGTHYSEYDIRLAPASGAEQADIARALTEVLRQTPGIVYEMNTFLTERVEETVSGYTAPVAVNIYGDDLAVLDQQAGLLEAILRRIPGAGAVQRRSISARPELLVDPDPLRMQSRGVDPGELTTTLAVAFAGETVGRVPRGAREVPVVVVGGTDVRTDVASLAALKVHGLGGFTPIGEFARLLQGEGRYNVLRRNGQRLQTVTCQVVGRDLAGFMTDLRQRVRDELPAHPNAYVEFTGSAVEQAESKQTLYLHAGLAGLGVLALASLALGSLRHVLLVAVNLPFALAGGIHAAVIAGGALSVGATIGFVTLFGITVRNAIMLVSHYRFLVEEEGQDWNRATALRGASERLPSILMTAAVTALAMLPIALDSDNPGREIMGPMATIIIGGLLSSTLLTLLVLPVLMLRFGRFRTGAVAGGVA